MKGREKEGKGREVNYILGSNVAFLCVIKSNYNHKKAKSKLTCFRCCNCCFDAVIVCYVSLCDLLMILCVLMLCIALSVNKNGVGENWMMELHIKLEVRSG